MARTNVVLDDKLVTECRKRTGIRTQRALIDYALQELLRRDRQREVLALQGTIQWQGNLAQRRKQRA